MIIIAPDKFKGTMSALQAARAIAAGLRDAGVTDELQLCPMADGGDGTAEVLARLTGQQCHVVESHAFIGPGCFGDTPPEQRSSAAFGVALRKALDDGGEVLAAIGGTACCDGGAGMLQAMGMHAYDADGRLIDNPLTPALLPCVARVDALPDVWGSRITALSDVRATLVPGEGGQLSALDFALQKGFAADRLQALEAALRHWQQVVAGQRRSAIDGAGGGVGFALATVLGARVCSGAEYVLDRYGVDFGQAELVVTGEGCIDAQTDGGKVVETVVRRARRAGAKVLAVGGRVEGRHTFPTLAVDAPGTPMPATTEEAMRRLRLSVGRYFNQNPLRQEARTV